MSDISEEAVENYWKYLLTIRSGMNFQDFQKFVLRATDLSADAIVALQEDIDALSARVEQLEAALKEAIEWNWIDHDDRSDDPHCIDRIPDSVTVPIFALLNKEPTT